MNEFPVDIHNTTPSEVLLDSRTIELNKYFGDKGALPQLLVLIEDEDDKDFWYKVFTSCVGQFYSSIDVWPLKEAAEKEQSQTDASGIVIVASGKDALMKVTGLGRSKMVAVDADYDLLIDGLHSYTNRLRSEKYIQHTIYYSIENHLLGRSEFMNLPELTTVCAEIEDYIYGIVGEEITHLQEVANSHPHIHALTTDRLRSALGSLHYHPTTFTRDIKDLMSKEFGSMNPKALPQYQKAKTLCASHGYNVHNLWQIMQGHTLYELIEKVMSYKMLNQRRIQESSVTNDTSISGSDKLKLILGLKHSLLGACKNENEKFRKDIYSCIYLDLSLPCIKDIQNKIVDDITT